MYMQSILIFMTYILFIEPVVLSKQGRYIRVSHESSKFKRKSNFNHSQFNGRSVNLRRLGCRIQLLESRVILLRSDQTPYLLFQNGRVTNASYTGAQNQSLSALV